MSTKLFELFAKVTSSANVDNRRAELVAEGTQTRAVITPTRVEHLEEEVDVVGFRVGQRLTLHVHRHARQQTHQTQKKLHFFFCLFFGKICVEIFFCVLVV